MQEVRTSRTHKIEKDKDMTTRIQDIEQLECDIYDVVDEYIQSRECYEHPQLKIARIAEGLTIDILESVERLDSCSETSYDMAQLVREEDGELIPDIDKINEIANEWIFLD